MSETNQEILTFLESLSNQGIKLGLDRMGELMALLGHPHKNYPTVLVGGTNGKGSTVRMISQILSSAGYITGSYYSPHLHSFRERFCVNDRSISESEFADLGKTVRRFADRVRDKPSQFEILTAMAFLYFRLREVQIAIMEVGLGGRWDAVNCTEPVLSVITNVELDHTARLGLTLEEIAVEKAGIIRPGRPLVMGAVKDKPGQVIESICAELGASVIRTRSAECIEQDTSGETFSYRGDVCRLSLLGAHQVVNAVCALEAAEVLQGLGFPTSMEQRRSALAQIRHPGRLEVLGGHPIIVLDGAHNPAGMEALSVALDRFPAGRRILVLGILEDKDIGNMVGAIVSHETLLVATRPRSPRAARTDRIASAANGARERVVEIPEVSKALDFARGVAGPDDLICITGSLTTVAEAREALLRADR